ETTDGERLSALGYAGGNAGSGGGIATLRGAAGSARPVPAMKNAMMATAQDGFGGLVYGTPRGTASGPAGGGPGATGGAANGGEALRGGGGVLGGRGPSPARLAS